MISSRSHRLALGGSWSRGLWLRDFWTDEGGATAIEYAGLLAILGVVLLTSVSVLGKDIGKLLDGITAAFASTGF